MSQEFNIAKLFKDVVDPQPGEVITFMHDVPHGDLKDNDEWQARREMTKAWRDGVKGLCDEIGATLTPIVTYAATGVNNADLPETGECDGETVNLGEYLGKSNVCFALTEYSASAPLIKLSNKYPTFRGASLPGVTREMEKTALSADYSQVARWAQILTNRLTRAESARTIFSTGHEFTFDLRHRVGDSDDGYLHTDKTGIRLINLPSGEACIVPYEGEIAGDPSRTEGQIPVQLGNEIAVLQVKANRIIGAEGLGSETEAFSRMLMVDRARQNIAELGLGCNPQAVISGKVLEDEKVGFHWAFGRSEHLGGQVSPAHFARPEHVLHEDIVYAKGCPITVKELMLVYPDGTEEIIIKDSEYTILD